MKFTKFQDICKYMRWGVVDDYHPECFEPTCRMPERKPPDHSWAKCDEWHCPYYGMKLGKGTIYLDEKPVATMEAATAVLSEVSR